MLPEPMHRVPAKRQTTEIAKRDEPGAIALRETGGDQVEAALLLEQAWSGARSLLESNRTWRQVERVAAASQQVRTVDGDDVRKLCSLAN